jgi:multidrug resistance protein
MLALSCFATFLTAYSAGAYSPPVGLMENELHASRLAVLGGISTFCLGFALAPMVLAPFSEINGRYPVFVVSGVIFVVFQAICGVVTNLAGMLICRLLVGVGGSVFSTMVGGVIADLYDKKERNTPMSLFSGFVLVGTGAGPLIAAAMTQRLGRGDAWKWIFWHQVIAGGVLMILLVFFFKESRGSVLLSRKAKVLNRWYEQLEQAGYYGVWLDEERTTTTAPREDGSDSDQTISGQPTAIGGIASDEEKASLPDLSRPASSTSVSGTHLHRIRWVTKDDEERASLGKMISVSLYRPFHLLFTEPVVFFFSLWVAFAWAVLYLTFGSIPLVFSRQHGWDIEHAGRIFAAMMIGGVLGTVIGIWQEHVLHHPKWQPEVDSSETSVFWTFLRTRFPARVPEARLYCTCVVATLLPIGLFIFGFTSKRDIHWIAPTIGICLATIGIYSVYLATFNYLADTYHRYASSALAAQSCCRNMLGGVFPLVTTPLFTNLGEARAGALLGGIAVGLTLVPWALVFFGERIRARSRFASELSHS